MKKKVLFPVVATFLVVAGGAAYLVKKKGYIAKVKDKLSHDKTDVHYKIDL